MEYAHNELLFSNNKEWNFDTGYNMDESLKHAKWNKPETKENCMFPLIWNIKNRQIHRERKKIRGNQG